MFDINFGVYNENVIEGLVCINSKGDYEKLKMIFSVIDQSTVSFETDINNSWAKFTNILNNAAQLGLPVIKRHLGKCNKPKQWNSQIKTKLSHHNHTSCEYQLTQHKNNKITYEGGSAQNNKRLIKLGKKNLEIHIVSSVKSNPKEFYSYIRKNKSHYQHWSAQT